MHIISNLNDWIHLRNSLPTDSTIGFVPTMGNLHEGHASLFLASSEENNYTIASLFINPTQFDKAEDFTLYPRTYEADIHLMEQSGVDFCLVPQESDLYADGYSYQVQEVKLCQLMEGKHRVGHFNGVLTIVMKLLHLTRPTCAYFGEKDYQQYLLIQGMAKAFFMNVDIKSCPTIREASGLAFSSRNNRLSAEQKKQAERFATIFHQNKPCDKIKSELSAEGIKVDYVEEYLNRRFAAVFIGDIRLIDNYSLDSFEDCS